jgi:hypothetical protein
LRLKKASSLPSNPKQHLPCGTLRVHKLGGAKLQPALRDELEWGGMAGARFFSTAAKPKKKKGLGYLIAKETGLFAGGFGSSRHSSHSRFASSRCLH